MFVCFYFKDHEPDTLSLKKKIETNIYFNNKKIYNFQNMKMWLRLKLNLSIHLSINKSDTSKYITKIFKM